MTDAPRKPGNRAGMPGPKHAGWTGPPREVMDRFAAERHAKRFAQEQLAKLGAEYERTVGATAIARERHRCEGKLALELEQVRDAYRFRCSCGAEIEITGKEAAMHGAKP